MADQQLGPSKKEKEFPELRLRFWGGKNSVMGGLLAEAFMSPRRYHNLVADHKKARDARKAATAAVVATTSMKADEAVGEELSKAPTSADEKAEGTPNLEKAGRECNPEAKGAEAAEHRDLEPNDQAQKPTRPGPPEAGPANAAGRKPSSSSHHSIEQGSAHDSKQRAAEDPQVSPGLRGGGGPRHRNTSTITADGSARTTQPRSLGIPKPPSTHGNNGAQPHQQPPSLQRPPQPVPRPPQSSSSRPALSRPSAPPTIPQLHALPAHTIRPESAISQQVSADPAIPGHDRATPLGQHWQNTRGTDDVSAEKAPSARISEVPARQMIVTWIEGQPQHQQTSQNPIPRLDVAKGSCPQCGARWPRQPDSPNRPVSQQPAPSQSQSASKSHATSARQSHAPSALKRRDSPQTQPPGQSKCRCPPSQKQNQKQEQNQGPSHQGEKSQKQEQHRIPHQQSRTHVRQGSKAQTQQTSTSMAQPPKQASTDHRQAIIATQTSQQNRPPATSQSQQGSETQKPSRKGSTPRKKTLSTITHPGSHSATAVASASLPYIKLSNDAKSQKQTISPAPQLSQPLPPPPPPPPQAQPQPQQAPHSRPTSLSPTQRLRRAADHTPEGCYLTVVPPHSAPGRGPGPASTPRLPPFTLDANLADIASHHVRFGNLRGGGYATPSPSPPLFSRPHV